MVLLVTARLSRLQINLLLFPLSLFILIFFSFSSSFVSALQMPKISTSSNIVDGGGSLSVLQVQESGVESVNQGYKWQDASIIPPGFAKVCLTNKWDVEATWVHLNRNRLWLRGTTNEAYIYFNSADGHWWIDEPNGSGVFIAKPLVSNNNNNCDDQRDLPPIDGWKALSDDYEPLPTILIS